MPDPAGDPVIPPSTKCAPVEPIIEAIRCTVSTLTALQSTNIAFRATRDSGGPKRFAKASASGRQKRGEDYIRLRDIVVIAPDHIRYLGPTDSCNASAGQRSQHSRTMFAEATTHGGAHLARRYHGNC